MKIGHISPKRLADTIVEQLETMILEGTFLPGERLPAERVLAERFGVSRPSLREAVQKLAARGILVSRQGGGHYVAESLGSTFTDPLVNLIEDSPDAQRDLLEFRHTLEADCAYYAALRATDLDRSRLSEAYRTLERCYADDTQNDLGEEGTADAGFHLAIAEASHNVILLHTMRGLFNLLKISVVTNIGGMYARESATRKGLMQQHELLYRAIMAGEADRAREIAGEHIQYVQDVLSANHEQERRLARSRRRGKISPEAH